MRRTTLAMTTAMLGAALAASAVRAQQSNPQRGDLVDQSTTSDKAAGGNSARKPNEDVVYGMSPTRGSRYLLRNGLDYLSYKEYERALKFLREAESRKDELNAAEKQVLKKGIEAAQRGLRQAADAESPYALSEKPRNRNGFSPSKSEPAIVIQTDRSQALAGRSFVNRSNVPSSPVTNDADDRGEPIRLASGDAISSESRPQDPATARSSRIANNSAVAHRDADQPRQFPDIVKLPKLSQELNAADSAPSEIRKSAEQVSVHSLDRANDQLKVVNVPPQDGPAAQVSVPLSPVSSAPNSSELARPGTVDRMPPEAPNLTAGELAVIPTSPELIPTAPSVAPAEPAHSETEDSSTGATGPQMASRITVARAALSHGTPPAAKSIDDLPPLPTDLTSKAEAGDQGQHASPASMASLAITTPMGASVDELPPLPADVSRSAGQSDSNAGAIPTATADGPTPAANSSTAEQLPALPAVIGSGEPRTGVSTFENAPALPDVPPVEIRNAAVNAPDAGSEVLVPDAAGNSNEDVAAAPLPVGAETRTQTVSEPSVLLAPVPSRAAIAEGAQVTENDGASVRTSERAGESPKQTRSVVSTLDGTSEAPPAINDPPALPSRSDSFIPNRSNPPSTLRPELKREVEMIVRKQEDELRRKQQAQPAGPARDTIVSDLRAQTQLDISRAPSPAEARPIKAIPVPEDWVPLPPRTWVAQRKYWAAAATCHLPLYFQDPVLERYGHSVEQFVGPIGRYLTYPLDDPTQSTQRNQIIQPFFSVGLFAFQIAALPYNLIMDPPWEAQYDLGYYRPGDNIPTDTYWLPLHGYGPPLRGSNY